MSLSLEDDLWVPALVKERLVEAAHVIAHTAGPVGPKGYGSGLPGSMLDAMVATDDEGDEIPWWERASADEPPRKRGYPSRVVTRAEEASRWPIHYLAGHEGPRRVLFVYLRCKVYRKSFSKACRKRGWPRMTANRAIDRALGVIAQGLNSDGVMF